MSDPTEPSADPAGLRGPGDPEAATARQQHPDPDGANAGAEAVEARQPHAEPGQAGNIREDQLTQAGGTVPAAYVGSGDPGADGKPEDAVDAAGWDDRT